MTISSNLRQTDDMLAMVPDPVLKSKGGEKRGIGSKALSAMKVMFGSAALAVLGGAFIREVSTGEVTSNIDERGQLRYQHSDHQTAAILEFISGEGSFSEEEQLTLARRYVERTFRKAELDIPRGMEAMNFEELQSLLVWGSIEKRMRWAPKVSRSGDTDWSVPDLKLLFSDQCESLPGLYDVLWQMEREAGAPSLRWTFGDEHFAFHLDDHMPFYNPLTHTITLNILERCEGMRDTLFSEWAHSHQFQESTFDSGLAFTQSLYRMGGRFVSGTPLEECYAPEYSVQGSFENDAHVGRKSLLRAKFGAELALHLNEEIQRNYPGPAGEFIQQ